MVDWVEYDINWWLAVCAHQSAFVVFVSSDQP